MLAEKLDSYFGISEKGSSIRTEVRGGLIVFFSMAYILIVNPGMMADAGMNADAAFTATVIGSMVAMLIMALYAKFPIAQAPAMGVNAFFAYTVVLIMGYTWQQALAAVFMAGVLFLIISMTGFRKKILDAIPGTMSVAITAGIGFFIAFVGLHGCGLIAGSPTTLVTLGNFGNTSVQVALVGIILTSILYIKKIKGGLLIGILVTAAIGILAGVVSLPDSVISIPAMPDIGAFLDGLTSVQWDLEYLIVIFSFFMLNMFDSAGTIMAVSNTTGLTDEKGNIKDGNKALVSDAVGTVTGAMIGCTTISSYIESATGTEAGAKTGLMVLVVSIMFALALFFGPIFSVIG